MRCAKDSSRFSVSGARAADRGGPLQSPRRRISNVVPLRGRERPYVRGRNGLRWPPASFSAHWPCSSAGTCANRDPSLSATDNAGRGAPGEALSEPTAAPRPAFGSSNRCQLSVPVTGHYCRTFQLRDLGGLACNEAGTWKLEVLARGRHADNPDYRPAASNLPPAVVQAVTRLPSQASRWMPRRKPAPALRKWQK